MKEAWKVSSNPWLAAFAYTPETPYCGKKPMPVPFAAPMRLIMSRAILCKLWLASILPSVPSDSGKSTIITPSLAIVPSQ